MSDEGYEMKYINEAFETNWIAPAGANITEFEKELCDYVNIICIAYSDGLINTLNPNGILVNTILLDNQRVS